MSEKFPFPYPNPNPFKSQNGAGNDVGPKAIFLPSSGEPTPVDTEKPSYMWKFIVGIVVLLAILGGAIWFFLRDDKPNNEPPTLTGKNDKIVSQVISAKNGGTLTNKYGGKVIIPPGALSKDTEISMTLVDQGTVTDMYHLEPDGLKFLRPVTVVLPFKTEGLKKGQTAANIKIEFWNAEQKQKRPLPYRVDWKEHNLRVRMYNF
jgi:hypothetical protein